MNKLFFLYSANQATILEILNFVERIFGNVRRKAVKEPSIEKMKTDISPTHYNNEIIFDFFRLNVLILYSIKGRARKVGTLTISDAKINVSIESSLSIIGSLGGMQIIDINPQGIGHQRILSIGRDPETKVHRQSMLETLSNEIYLNNIEEEKSEQIDALSFTSQWSKNTPVSLHVRMASVSYTHSPKFLHDFNFCITTFKQSLR